VSIFCNLKVVVVIANMCQHEILLIALFVGRFIERRGVSKRILHALG
jgi:hypothetical protein